MDKSSYLGECINGVLTIRGTDVLNDVDLFTGLLSDFLRGDTEVIELLKKGYDEKVAALILQASKCSGRQQTNLLQELERYLRNSKMLDESGIDLLINGFGKAFGFEKHTNEKELEKRGFDAIDKGDYDEAYTIFSALAESGNRLGIEYKGMCLLYGYGCEESYDEGTRLVMSCTDESVTACLNLANYLKNDTSDELYIKAASIAQDDDTIEMVLEAANKLDGDGKHDTAHQMKNILMSTGNTKAVYAYARSLWDSADIVDRQLSIKYYEQAGASGNSQAYFELGAIYDLNYTKLEISRNPSKAVDYYQKAAQLGNGSAMVNLSFCYLEGNGVPVDKEKALQLLHRSAEVGDANGLFGIGLAYDEGELVNQDIPRAIEYYKRAVSAGNREALHNLVLIYTGKDSKYKDIYKAIDLLLSEINKDNADAAMELARIYQFGPENNRDLNKTVKYYTKAAELGSVRAYVELGMIRELDYDTEDETTENLFLTAAEKGDPYGMYNLALLYGDDESELFDYSKGVYWAKKAIERHSELGDDKMNINMDELEDLRETFSL